MAKEIKIKINGRAFECQEGDTIGYVAHANGIKIPGLCFHPDFPFKGNCRLCVVEIKGRRKLETSCSTLAEDGMEIFTDSERVKKERNLNIELIFAEHIEKCPTCIWRFECPLLGYAKEYGVEITKFPDRKGRRERYQFANAVEIDGTQCIDCRNCLDACALLQKIDCLELKGKGVNQEVVPKKAKHELCILCGQCALHCPVSAAQEQAEWQVVESLLKDKSRKGQIVVAQFAPSVRVTIGEDFGLAPGQIMTDQVTAGLKALGFDYVFDVSMFADVTTLVEAEELLERLKEKKGLPMFTSCCPGWVNYVEIYYPRLIPHLTTARSPHIHGGGSIKTFWARKMKVDPKNIIVVSVMPCTAKKYEAIRTELEFNGLNPVDHVITTRELTFMLKKNNIDFANLKKDKAIDPFGQYSGAGVLFGGTGGVMESALRTAYFMTCGDEKGGLCRSKIEFDEVRGMDGIREAKIKIAGQKLKVAVVNGIAHAPDMIERLKEYDYVEVMACPGGCIGGGGQPIPTTPDIRQKRIEAIYSDDGRQRVRKSYENKIAVDIVDWLKKHGKLAHQVLHTHFKKRIRY